MPSWNPVTMKAQLRHAMQRLAQLQEKNDSQGQITRRDIATLLQQNDVELARTKAQNLLQDDILGDLLEILEMHMGLILEHFNEIDKNATPSPVVVEAASSIIYAAPHIHSRDLGIVRDILVQWLGTDFARSAVNNQDDHVALRVVRALSAPPPTAIQLDHQLANIAATYSVKWMPQPARQDRINELSELLDAEVSQTLDLEQLRKLCSQGIPDHPPWLRPRLWKIFFGIISTKKTLWKKELQNQRESYYSLVRRLLEPFSSMLPPTSHLESHDATLLNVSKQLDRIPSSLLAGLQEDPETSDLCPLDDRAPDNIKIDCATNLDTRLRSILERDATSTLPSFTPEIRIEADDSETLDVSASSAESPRSHASTKLLSSKAYNSANADHRHMSALLRLLYLHSCINPAIYSPHLPSILVPLYSVFLLEIEPHDLAHVEADTFWLFEAMMGEFSELLDEEGNSMWMKRFGERIAWADEELYMDLYAKGLDPALPHYSHRWLAPLLTQTIPPSSVITVWDAMFSRPMRDRQTNPKIDYLLDFCTAMLIRAKPALFKLGKSDGTPNGLWTDDNDGRLPSLLPVSSFGDAFLEAISLLQQFSVQSAGGIDRLLQTAAALCHRRTEETKLQKADHQGLGARLKFSVLKGLGRFPFPDDDKPIGSDGVVPDDGSETETPQSPRSSGMTSRLAQTVWKGITNQTVMEPPASPATPSSSSQPATPPTTASDLDSSSRRSSISSLGSGSLWSYAEKLKDSDAMASLTKASTNWRAKAMLGGWSMTGASMTFLRTASTTAETQPHARAESVDLGTPSNIENGKHVSSPDANTYMPPERPAYFQPPRDSMLPQPRRSPISLPGSPEMSPQSESSLLSKAHLIRASLSSLSHSSITPPPEVKTVPRPLLLSSTSLITSPRLSPGPSSGVRDDFASDRDQWSAVNRANGESMHKTSQSPALSLSASDAWGRSPKYETRSDRDSDSGAPSRIVPLNRKSVSPMAAGIRTRMRRPTSPASSGTSSDRGFTSPTESMQPFPSEATQPQIVTDTAGINFPRSDYEQSVPSTEPNLPPIVSSRRMLKKRVTVFESEADDTSDSSLGHAPSKISRSARLTRRNLPNLNLRTRELPRPERVPEPKAISLNSLTTEYPLDHDMATTPRAASFNDSPSLESRSPRRTRKHSGENAEARPRTVTSEGNDVLPKKIMTDVIRTRKISGEGRARNSAAIDGDDEGYDDLLSAYESEARH